ncbi:MAG: hypothetical protein ACFB15_28320 [Cyclobacteriaceae bacterium]
MKYIIIVLSLLLSSCGNKTTKTGEQQNESIKMKSKTSTTYNLPKDVISKIRIEYSDNDNQEFIINSLIQLGIDWEFKSARVPRCILFLSKGDFDSFKDNLKSAETDWRDVIYWAEYDSKDNQIYDFNKPFEENGL